MDSFIKRFAIIVVSLFLFFYVGYQAFRAVYSPIQTEMVTSQSLYETIDTQVLAIRNETIIDGDGKVDGFLSYDVENGDRVAKDGIIASVYPDSKDSITKKELSYINKELKNIEELEVQGDAAQGALNTADTNIWQNIHALSNNSNSARMVDLSRQKLELLTLMNKHQMTVGKAIDFSERKKKLTDEKARLEGGFTGATRSIKSPVAGYFANGVDDYEKNFNLKDVLNLEYDKIENAIAEKPPLNKTGFGKVVGDFEWYLTCVVPTNETTGMAVDGEYDIILPFVVDEAVPVTLIKNSKAGEGNSLLIFRCDYMSKELSSIRVETAQIRLKEYKGLQVLSSRVMRNDDGDMGVYAMVGDTLIFKKVEILHSNREYVLCSTEAKEGYLKLYDEIVVEGSGLYDGKTVT